MTVGYLAAAFEVVTVRDLDLIRPGRELWAGPSAVHNDAVVLRPHRQTQSSILRRALRPALETAVA